MIISDAEARALIDHVEGRACASCSAYFSPAVIRDVERGKRELSREDAGEVLTALLDCGSLWPLAQRLQHAGWNGDA